MQTVDLETEFEPSLYNALVSPEQADLAVRARGMLNGVLAESARVFMKHRVTELFGISLLHKHNDCPERTWMTEYNVVIGGENALATKMVVNSPTSEDAVPTKWQFHDETHQPLEFSTDPRAKRLFNETSVSQGFVDEFATILQRHSASRFLGLAIVDRELFHRSVNDEVGFEYSTTEPSNVVVLRSRAKLQNTAIETAWTFPINAQGSCARVCNVYCITAMGGHTASHTNVHSGPS
jgi:hypothetical protein